MNGGGENKRVRKRHCGDGFIPHPSTSFSSGFSNSFFFHVMFTVPFARQLFTNSILRSSTSYIRALTAKPSTTPYTYTYQLSRSYTMDAFEYNSNPGRVVFGAGSIKKLGDEVKRLGLSRPLLLSTPQQVDQAQSLSQFLNGEAAGIFTEATMHTPTHITDKALEYAKSVNADSVISIGGGSTIGLGKAISIRTGLPHICIPTTYAGSEMTPILGETQDGLKKTRSDPKILPGTVIYDVDYTKTLPTGMSAYSGVNAIAHAGMH